MHLFHAETARHEFRGQPVQQLRTTRLSTQCAEIELCQIIKKQAEWRMDVEFLEDTTERKNGGEGTEKLAGGR